MSYISTLELNYRSFCKCLHTCRVSCDRLYTWPIGSAKALLGLIFRVLAKTSRSKVQYLPRYLCVTACNCMYVSI